MAAKAIVVRDGNNKPITNYEALLGGTTLFNYGNVDGYLLYYSVPAGSTYIRILANGFKPAVYPITLDDSNQEIHFGDASGQPNTIHFPALSFNKPSRDSIINVKANFCNLYDAQNIPLLDGFIDTLIVEDPNRAEDWVSRLKAAGSTHITLTLSGDYWEDLGWDTGAPGNRYPIAGHDWTNDLLGFSQILDWVQAHELIPFIKLATDGQAYDPLGWSYGWKWGMDNLPRILSYFSKYWDSCLWSTGFDGCFPNWSAEQTIQMLKMLRSVLGETGNIDTEFAGPGSIGYCHMGRGEEDWADDKLGLLDCFSTELQIFPAEAEGIAETATRLLGPAARNTVNEPYYLAQTSKKINICFFETVAYWFSHKQTTDYKTAANLGKYYGFTSFGNGLPD